MLISMQKTDLKKIVEVLEYSFRSEEGKDYMGQLSQINNASHIGFLIDEAVEHNTELRDIIRRLKKAIKDGQ